MGSTSLRKSMKNIVLIGLLMAMVGVGKAQSPASNINVDDDRLALAGYDPVSYFESAEPVKGKKEYTYNLDGAVYRFSSQKNRDRFIAAPLKYVPQYGGWCAYAMGAEGEKVEVDPETFKIIDGKLYLFYNRFFNNTLDTWNKNETNLKARADANWKRLTSQ
jgi:YHS domain-containing protein